MDPYDKDFEEFLDLHNELVGRKKRRRSPDPFQGNNDQTTRAYQQLDAESLAVAFDLDRMMTSYESADPTLMPSLLPPRHLQIHRSDPDQRHELQTTQSTSSSSSHTRQVHGREPPQRHQMQPTQSMSSTGPDQNHRRESHRQEQMQPMQLMSSHHTFQIHRRESPQRHEMQPTQPMSSTNPHQTHRREVHQQHPMQPMQPMPSMSSSNPRQPSRSQVHSQRQPRTVSPYRMDNPYSSSQTPPVTSGTDGMSARRSRETQSISGSHKSSMAGHAQLPADQSQAFGGGTRMNSPFYDPTPQVPQSTEVEIDECYELSGDELTCHCGRKYRDTQHLLSHQKRQHRSKKPAGASCEKCGAHFTRADTAKKHAQSCKKSAQDPRPEPKKVAQCDICKKWYSSKAYLKIHLCQGSPNRPPLPKPEVKQCEKCLIDYALDKIDKHRDSCQGQHGQRPKSASRLCLRCKNRFELYEIDAHKAQCKGVRKKVCKKCGNEFDYADMRLHEEQCKETGSYPCILCGRNFARVDTLALHRRDRCPKRM